MAVEVLHEPSKSLIVLGRTGINLPVEGLCNLLLAGFFSFKAIELGGELDLCHPTCPGEISSAWGWCCSLTTPRGSSSGLALPGVCAAGYPSLTA